MRFTEMRKLLYQQIDNHGVIIMKDYYVFDDTKWRLNDNIEIKQLHNFEKVISIIYKMINSLLNSFPFFF